MNLIENLSQSDQSPARWLYANAVCPVEAQHLTSTHNPMHLDYSPHWSQKIQGQLQPPVVTNAAGPSPPPIMHYTRAPASRHTYTELGPGESSRSERFLVNSICVAREARLQPRLGLYTRHTLTAQADIRRAQPDARQGLSRDKAMRSPLALKPESGLDRI